MFQVKVSFVKDVKKQEEMWERQHEVAADKIYNMCYDLGGFFLKVFYFSARHFLWNFVFQFNLKNSIESHSSMMELCTYVVIEDFSNVEASFISL